MIWVGTCSNASYEYFCVEYDLTWIILIQKGHNRTEQVAQSVSEQPRQRIWTDLKMWFNVCVVHSVGQELKNYTKTGDLAVIYVSLVMW